MFTIVELLNAREPLIKLSNQSIPVIVAFRLLKILKSVNEELSRFDEIRSNLLKKYGSLNSENQFHISEENSVLINSELTPILEETVNLDFAKIDLNDFKDANMTAFELMAIEKFIK
jgi:hypothetical protein